MVIEIPWVRFNPTTEHYRRGEYLFKRIMRNGLHTHEVWRNGSLDRNNMGYWDTLKYLAVIIQRERP